ncbi:MAG: hypothetical protein IPP74_14765 [Alphaproteobacteria bacterium]|nr:hypothetical protein [Alphaproteobacteria bacterium]
MSEIGHQGFTFLETVDDKDQIIVEFDDDSPDIERAKEVMVFTLPELEAFAREVWQNAIVQCPDCAIEYGYRGTEVSFDDYWKSRGSK